jgi:hypothetical protein
MDDEQAMIQQAVNTIPPDNNGIRQYIAALFAFHTIAGH